LHKRIVRYAAATQEKRQCLQLARKRVGSREVYGEYGAKVLSQGQLTLSIDKGHVRSLAWDTSR